MSESTDCNDSAMCQLTLAEEPPSGYLLQKVVSTLMSHFNIMDTGTTSCEAKDGIPPIMRDADSPQNWKYWNAVYPPTTQNYSQKVVQATMEVAKSILMFPEYSIKEVISELQTSLSPKMIAVDWTLYLYLLEHDKGVLSKHQFSTPEEYDIWKKTELGLVKGLLNGELAEQEPSSYSRVTAGYSIAQLSLTRAKNLHKKAMMSGIYSVIHFQDLYTVSSISNSLDQNPSLNHNLSFLLRDAGCSDGNPVIVVSLWFKRQGIRSEGFLGYIKFTVQDLLQFSDGKERGFELQKRSNRSNVSGEIYMKIRRIQAKSFIKDLYAEIMTCIPFCYEACLRDLLEVWYSRHISATDTVKDEYGCRAIIDTISIAWNAPYYTTTIISSDVLFKLYTQKKIPLTLLKTDVLNQCMSFLEAEQRKLPIDAKNKILKFFDNLYEHLQERLLFVLNADINESTSREFMEIVEVLSIMHSTDSLGKKDIEVIIKDTIKDYMDNTHVIIFSEQGPVYGKVKKYIYKLKTLLSSSLFNLNEPINGITKVPEIVAALSAVDIYETLLKHKNNLGEEIEETFKAYDATKEFIEVCKIADPDSASKIYLRDLFFEGVISWLDKADTDMMKWVMNAIKLDNFQIIAPNTYHTTSIIDIFSCFSIHVNFIKNLNWENKEDEQLFNELLYGSVLKCLKMYTAQMITLIKEEVNAPGSSASPKTNKEVDTQEHENGVVTHYTNGVKKLGSVNGVFKITSNICAYLNNINVIVSKIENLLELNKLVVKFSDKPSSVHKLSEVTIPKTLSLRSQRQIKNSFIPVKIVVEKLEITVIKFPHLMPVSVRLTYNGSVVLNTKAIVPQPSSEYNDVAWINLSDGIDSDTTTLNPAKNKSICSKLEVSIVKMIYGNNSIDRNEEVISSAFIDIEWSSSEEKVVVVSIPDCGKLTLKIAPVNPNHRLIVLPNIVRWLIESSVNESHYIIAHKIASVYRGQIKTISHKFKSISKDYINKMFNSLEVLEKNKKSIASSINSIIPQQQIDQEIVSKELGPVLSFLNANLERIVSECQLMPAIKLISKTWDQIMLANESLLVPLNIESRKEKSAWSQDRVKFLEVALQIIYIFFECDGEGLSKEELNTPRYKHVVKIMKNYFESRKVLYSKKQFVLGDVNGNTDDSEGSIWLPAYWIFQILKVHGDNESVYVYIRNIVDLFKQLLHEEAEGITGLSPISEAEKVK